MNFVHLIKQNFFSFLCKKDDMNRQKANTSMHPETVTTEFLSI